MRLPVLIIGGGGHARVLIDMIRLRSTEILGIIDIDPGKTGNIVSGVKIIGDESVLAGYRPEELLLVNAVGSVHLPKVRTAIFDKFEAMGFCFATVVHPASIVSSDAILGEGVQIMAGAVVQPGRNIGKDSIINTGALVDHDCSIGEHVHLAPGVTLSGGVKVGNGVHIGTGASVIHGVNIGNRSVIAAGAVVIDDVESDSEVAGVPARRLFRRT